MPDAISVYFHHATPGLEPEVELYQNAEWVSTSAAVHRRRGISMADITVIGAFIFAAIVKLPVPAEYEALHAWHGRMQARPSVRAWNSMVEETKAAALR